MYNEYGELMELVLLDSRDRDETKLNRDTLYGAESFKQDSQVLYITDKIKNMLAINEMIKKPAIVINSLKCLNFRVFNKFYKII